MVAAAGVGRSALWLRAGIIGASHVLELRPARRAPLYEVFACRDVRAPEAPGRWLYSGGVRDLQDTLAFDAAPGVGYRFRSQVVDPGAGRQRLARLEARVARASPGCGEIGLAHTFPAAGRLGGGPLVPRTVVWAHLDPDLPRIRVETAHCYPNEGVIVFSQTRIAVAEGPSR